MLKKELAAELDLAYTVISKARGGISMADRFYSNRKMTFVWDEDKFNINLRKHKISFYEAAAVFDDPQRV